jgi:hypothetical protein
MTMKKVFVALTPDNCLKKKISTQIIILFIRLAIFPLPVPVVGFKPCISGIGEGYSTTVLPG